MSSIIFLVIFLLVSLQEAVSFSRFTTTLCPKDFLRIYNKCYYFSHEYETWERANWKCQERNSTLAVVINKNQNTALREFLRRGYIGKTRLSTARAQTYAPRWMGGQYDWRSAQWKWIYNGKPIRYNQFDDDNVKNKSLAWHCLILDPRNAYKWNSTSCFEKHHYICQTHQLNPQIQPEPPSAQTKSNSDQNGNNGDVNNTEQHNDQAGFVINVIEDKKIPKKPRRKMVCPKNFIRGGRKCYYLSRDKANWNSAYYKCQDLKSELAVFKSIKQDQKLRVKLRRLHEHIERRWMGGYFDFKNSLWKWAATGSKLPVHPKVVTDLKWSCLLWDPNLPDRWTSETCMVPMYYMCQTDAVPEERKPRQRKRTNKPKH